MKTKPLILLLLISFSLFGQGTVSLSSTDLEIEIDLEYLEFYIDDIRTGSSYMTESIEYLAYESHSAIPNGYHIDCSFEGIDCDIEIRLNDDIIRFDLITGSELEIEESFPFPGRIIAREADYFIIPFSSGLIFPSMDVPDDFLSFTPVYWKGSMGFYGVTDFESGFVIITPDPWDIDFYLWRPSAAEPYGIEVYHEPPKGKFGYDKTIYYSFFDTGGYVEIASRYRNHIDSLGWTKTLAEKKSDNPNVNKLIGAADLWHEFRDDDSDNLKFLKNCGFEKLLISLSFGWYMADTIPDIIDEINDNGWLSGRYDIATDVWPPDSVPEWAYWLRTDGYPEDIIIEADTSLKTGWVTYLDDEPYQGYYTCSETHAEYVRSRLLRDLSRSNWRARFMDVEMANGLYECYSPGHPITRKHDAYNRAMTLSMVTDTFNLICGSEEFHDWATAYFHYSEGTMTIFPANNAGYDWSLPITGPGEKFLDYNVNPAVRIPLQQLVLHDCHVSTWYTGDGQSKVPAYWDHKDLFNILYGSMPLIFPPDLDFFEDSLVEYVTSYHLAARMFEMVGDVAMIDHEHLTDDWLVQKTEFANGWTVVANFDDSDFGYESKVLPSLGFYATNGDEEIMRIRNGENQYAAAALENSLFIRAYGHEFGGYGIYTDGTVFLRNDSSYIHLAIFNDASYIDISQESLIWPLETVMIYKLEGSSPLPITEVHDGYYRFTPIADDTIFYRIEGLLSIEENIPRNQGFDLQAFPNPFNGQIQIDFPKNSTQITIYDIEGRSIYSKRPKPNECNFIWQADNSIESGIYFIQASNGKRIINHKILYIQ